MIEIHDDWQYIHLWYVQGERADYTALAFRRIAAVSCEAIARFRYFKSEEERKHGLIDGTDSWVSVPLAHGAGPNYVTSLMDNVVNNIAVHPEFGPPGTVVVHKHAINSGGAVFRDIIASAPWAA